ncbi:coatomer epsilon subunit [Trypanosoma rangeli]|uniref:Coatomer subunit epsilon n=1 Tax=Trypanosoma rangeli TaxID=5698 RepID=A0A3R7RKY5_TRYRA|nr:coatomer epsilon subunit [Trypanosoma rangeli]RNF06239.1 coatomer epsilon subunit [Trypanosoma rangeli]|eukprot:RNF06239.1 coatomer epsilon subunit [Trypanosoma rangeli]
MADPFYEARNALTVGNYHQALAEAGGAKTTLRKQDEVTAFNTEREALLCLAQIGLGQGEAVVTQLATATHPTLQAVKHWAQFSLAIKNQTPGAALTPAAASALEQLTQATEEVSPAHIQVAVLAASALLASGDSAGAIKLAKKWIHELPTPEGGANMRKHMELRVVVVEALLRMQRPEMARGEVSSMEQLDDESILTVLCSGIVSLHEGPQSVDAYRRALERFKELSIRCGPSVLAHNLAALAQMELGDFEAAERSLLDALAMRSGDVDTTSNLAVVSSHLGKAADSTNRYTQQATAITGAWSHRYAAMNARLNEAVLQFSTTA